MSTVITDIKKSEKLSWIFGQAKSCTYLIFMPETTSNQQKAGILQPLKGKGKITNYEK